MNALAQLEESLLGTNDSSMSLPNEESENHVQSTHPLTFTIIIWFYFFLHFFLYIYIEFFENSKINCQSTKHRNDTPI